MLSRNILISSLLFSFLSSQLSAAVVFSNGGSLNGWDDIFVENEGYVTTSSTNYAGSQSLKMYQEFESDYTGRYHSHCTLEDTGADKGDIAWYGFAFRLSSTWDFYEGSSIWLFQNTLRYPSNQKKPNVWIKVGSDRKLEFSKQYGTFNNASKKTKTLTSNLQTGVWYKVVVKVKYSTGNDGYVKVWLDGISKQISGPNAFTDHNDNFRAHWGLYCTDWYGKTSVPADDLFVYMDSIKVGDGNSSYSEVEP